MTRGRGRPMGPVTDGPFAAFAQALRNLWQTAGEPPVRTLAALIERSPATVSTAMSGRSLPSLAVTLAMVKACGGDAEEWRARWNRAVNRDGDTTARPQPTVSVPDASASARVRVALVTEQTVLAEGIRSMILADPGRRLDLVATGPTVDSVPPDPDVLVIDQSGDDVRFASHIAATCAPGRRVIAHLRYPPRAEAVRAALDAGAVAVLDGSTSGDALVETILAVADDRPTVPPAMVEAMNRDTSPRLSQQERTALLLWFQSMSKQSVARRMGISEATVRDYIHRARMKYASVGRPAPTKTDLLARAIQDGVVRIDEIEEYRSYANIGPDPQSHVRRGLALFRARRVEEAVAAFEEAITHYHQGYDVEGMSQALLRLGLELDRAGRPEDSAAAFEQAMAVLFATEDEWRQSVEDAARAEVRR
ncbi:sigma factor-like helix-turn-helix DNA-binding protein [Spongiactinospora sp. TRM90649]|uniref:helix-turn-helix transcriptional regulator n=1 Tax=Spongiactinospora sp. TRM90649 TaxID=3031114 RepID=UPI0023F6A6A6|nr:sigma factor-like helix-turn-helix DNA-binding protein [Spongiactinospora sp. TRM90649]MDF5756414.1 sigma factor-like helix-turn-helix DNA-binding protein [Spongiactinospora sp. TRM90649]